MAEVVKGPSRLVNRSMPYGVVEAVMGGKIHCSDMKDIELDSIFGHNFFDNCRPGYFLIWELVGEIVVLRKLLTETTRRLGPKITDANEFHRGVISMANKIGEHPDDVRTVLEPVIKQLMGEMLDPPKQQETGTERSTRERHEFIESGRGQP